MSFEVSIKKKAPVTTLVASMEVRYWEDAEVNDVEDDPTNPVIPLRKGNLWNITVDLATGKIKDWPQGTTAITHYKVCDAGIYALLDADGTEVVRKADYVPSMLAPGGRGYGDYVILMINADGIIEQWEPDLSYFDEDDD
jgi:hypothetical protein